MSVIRFGLARTRKFAEGWDAIFGKKDKKKSKARAKTAKKKTRKKR